MTFKSGSDRVSYIALLYSVVLGKARRVVMRDLKSMAQDIGLGEPRTVAATGNLVFEAAAVAVEQLECDVEAAFEDRFGRPIDIIVRRATDWPALMRANPFVRAAEADAALVSVRVMRAPLTADTEAMLMPYLAKGEAMAIVAGDLWVHFAHGHAGSRLATAVTTKRLGIGTWRNWNTICKLGELVG